MVRIRRPERFGDIPSYRLLEKPHARVHDNVHAMLAHLDCGWEHNIKVQESIFESMQATENASHEVMQLIDKLVVEKHG
jgi:hypothetical protein